MKQKILFLLLWTFLCSLPGIAKTVSFSTVYDNPKLVNKTTGEEIEIPEVSNYRFKVELEPGTYVYSQENYSSSGAHYSRASMNVEITDDGRTSQSVSIQQFAITVNFSTETDSVGNKIYWQLGRDYTVGDVYVLDKEKNIHRDIEFGEYYEADGTKNANKRCFIAGSGWYVYSTYTPTDLHPDYAPNLFSWMFGGSYSSRNVTFTEALDFKLSFPQDATGELTFKKDDTNYIPFVHVEPDSKEVIDGMNVYTYRMSSDSKQYSYRISRPGNMTRAAIITPDKVKEVTVTDSTLSAESDHYFNHEVWGNGTNYADIFLNINKRNLLRMKSGEDFQIVNLRTWQITNNSTSNYFIEPDYNWTVLNTSFQPDTTVINVNDNGVIKAKAPGTAIVQVRYTALGLSAMGGDKWSELWAENTGTFVVTVDADADKAPADSIRLAYKPDIEIDCEHDILYYMEGQPGYKLTFTPDDGTTVTVANPLVDQIKNTVSYPDAFSDKNVTTNADGSVTVLLTFGRNIIRTTDVDGNSNYQVLSAKPITVESFTARTDKYLLPGDDVKVQFKGLYHISGKLASVYNNNCHLKFNDYVVFLGVLLGSGQYDFAGNAVAQQFPFTFADDATEDYVMKGGCLAAEGYGSSPGAHRAVDYIVGLKPNFSAGIVSSEFGSIPDQVIKLNRFSEVDSLSVFINMGARVIPVKMSAIRHAFGEKAAWVMADDSIARVDNTTGEVFPLKGGKTTMKVVADPTKRNSEALLVCVVEVENDPDFVPVTGISFDDGAEKEIKMDFNWGNWGNYNNIAYVTVTPSNATNKRVIFTSSNPEYVAFSRQGLATKTSSYSIGLFWNDNTKAPGESVISAETEDGAYKSQILIRWMKASTNVALDESEISLNIGEKYTLISKIEPEDCSYTPVWSSSDDNVVKVDQNGEITAVSEGTATVSLSCMGRYGNNIAKCEVTVVDPSGIENVAADDDSFIFWPNLARGIVNIRTAAAAKVDIYSISGALVLTEQLAEGVNMLDISGLGSGIYLVRVGNKTKRLICR